ncbi:hypothetical protein DFH07DRAFT_765131 [Mycena maculata]|uniref:Uncharacterized protein n=1 Tax=Mycena maculata TaxID=230809 RepID=A0AAD7K8G5_9AGAR|nr:hypothetical protein DFH07DRAFT_765131 [Mycena maculata]
MDPLSSPPANSSALELAADGQVMISITFQHLLIYVCCLGLVSHALTMQTTKLCMLSSDGPVVVDNTVVESFFDLFGTCMRDLDLPVFPPLSQFSVSPLGISAHTLQNNIGAAAPHSSVSLQAVRTENQALSSRWEINTDIGTFHESYSHSDSASDSGTDPDMPELQDIIDSESESESGSDSDTDSDIPPLEPWTPFAHRGHYTPSARAERLRLRRLNGHLHCLSPSHQLAVPTTIPTTIV